MPPTTGPASCKPCCGISVASCILTFPCRPGLPEQRNIFVDTHHRHVCGERNPYAAAASALAADELRRVVERLDGKQLEHATQSYANKSIDCNLDKL